MAGTAAGERCHHPLNNNPESKGVKNMTGGGVAGEGGGGSRGLPAAETTTRILISAEGIAEYKSS